MAAVLQGLDPWFVDKAVSPLEARAALAAAFGQAGSGSGPEGGIVPGRQGGGLGVSATTPSASMAVTVSAGAVVIPRTNQQGYVGVLTAAGNVDIGTANATNPRIDVVIARVRDSDLGDASNGVWSKGWGVEVVAGTPSASPVAPSLTGIPCIPLAEVRVDASVTSIASGKITDKRYFTRASGAPRLDYNDGGRTGNNPWDLRQQIGTGILDTWDGSAWVPLAQPGAWTAYTPTVTATGGALNLGSGGSIIGRYVRLGKTLILRIRMEIGSGNDTKSGTVLFGLPAGMTISSAAPEQTGSVKLYNGPSGAIYPGVVYAPGGTTTIQAFMPESAAVSSLAALRSANSPGVPGTGIPSIGGQYTLDTNSNVVISAVLEIA